MRKIKLGDTCKCDLFIPFARTLLEMVLFKIGRNKVDIVLDPRLDGFYLLAINLVALKNLLHQEDRCYN